LFFYVPATGAPVAYQHKHYYAAQDEKTQGGNLRLKTSPTYRKATAVPVSQ